MMQDFLYEPLAAAGICALPAGARRFPCAALAGVESCLPCSLAGWMPCPDEAVAVDAGEAAGLVGCLNRGEPECLSAGADMRCGRTENSGGMDGEATERDD